MPRPGEDRSDVGGAAQFNNIGPVPLSAFCPAFRFPLSAFAFRFVPLSALSRFPLCPAFRFVPLSALSRFPLSDLSRFPLSLSAFPHLGLQRGGDHGEPFLRLYVDMLDRDLSHVVLPVRVTHPDAGERHSADATHSSGQATFQARESRIIHPPSLVRRELVQGRRAN